MTAFGVNAIVLPPSYETGRHYHDEQEELYFVHSGRIEIEFGDGSRHSAGPRRPGPGRRPHLPQSPQPQRLEDAVYRRLGGKDGYVGRDGRLPEGETTGRNAGD